MFFADDTHHLGELGEAACRDSESGPPPPPSLPPPPPPPAQDSGPPDCLQMVYDRSDAMTTACCANPADCETGAPTRCSEDCSDVLEPYFEICSGWIAGDPDFGAILQPLIGMCEEAKFGAYSGSLFSHRCSTKAPIPQHDAAGRMLRRGARELPRGRHLPPAPRPLHATVCCDLRDVLRRVPCEPESSLLVPNDANSRCCQILRSTIRRKGRRTTRSWRCARLSRRSTATNQDQDQDQGQDQDLH